MNQQNDIAAALALLGTLFLLQTQQEQTTHPNEPSGTTKNK